MGMIMPLTNCGYCEHGNPPDSKYCNACGATLTLAPCPRCGAVLEITATTCYQCHGSKQESSKDALIPEADRAHSRAELALKNDLRIDKLESALVLKKVNEKSELPSLNEKRKFLDLKDLTKLAKLISFKTAFAARRLSLAAIVGTGAIAIVAFIGYYAYRHYPLDSPPSSSAADIEVKVRSGAAQPSAIPGSAATASVPVTATPTSTVSPCTERVAALGLCTPGPVPKNEAEAVAPVPAAAARPQASNGGEPCTVAVAALGLCTPPSK
jgi:ribosomal protein L40E